MPARRTVRRKKSSKTVPKKGTSAKDKRLSSSTMQIPIEAVFGSIPSINASHLDVSCPGRDPQRIALADETIIGRGPHCTVPLPLSNVSREHACVKYDGEEYVIEDLGSTNGTFVNNVRVNRCVLRKNDLIRIGESRILFVEQKLR